MRSQDRRWSHWADRPFEASLDCRCFAGLGADSNDLFILEDLLNGHGNGLPRHSREIPKPARADLLPAARFIEIHDKVWIVRLEIGWRIIEGEMAVFAD